MRYKGKVYRPPSEAYSLIVQVTYGCSHNRCAFCDMYDDKHFAMRPMEEIREDFEMARQVYRRVERVFLAGGPAPCYDPLFLLPKIAATLGSCAKNKGGIPLCVI